MKDFAAKDFGKGKEPTLKEPVLPGMGKLALSLAGMALVLMTWGWLPIYLAGDLKEVQVSGNRILSAQALVSRLELGSTQVSWWNLDPYVLGERLLEEPWVEKAEVKKTSSLGLMIQVTERTPVAFVKAQDQLFLMDKDRVLLSLPDKQRFWELPVISDPALDQVREGDRLDSAALSRAFHLMKLLESDPVIPLSSVSEILLSDPLNLRVITLPGGLEFRFGLGDFEEKLKRLHQASGELSRREHRLVYVDLRHPQGLVIKRK